MSNGDTNTGIPCPRCGGTKTTVTYEHMIKDCNTRKTYPSGEVRDATDGLPRSIKCPGCAVMSDLPPRYLKCTCGWQINY